MVDFQLFWEMETIKKNDLGTGICGFVMGFIAS
jgi:hypothetical protein